MISRPLVVVVTGSECTGKTTLAGELAAAFAAPCSPEFAREYLDGKSAALDASDVEPIARGQIRGEDAAIAASSSLVIKDTDLVSTVVYSRHYYGSCPAWVEGAARERLGDLYLLLHPDVAWVADGLQRDRPGGRAHLHDLFRAELVAVGARMIDVTGSWDERRVTAAEAVESLLERVSRFGIARASGAAAAPNRDFSSRLKICPNRSSVVAAQHEAGCRHSHSGDYVPAPDGGRARPHDR